MADASIEIRGLTVRRGGLTVLRDVSLDCGPGLHALRGANGSGKSTLLRTVAGITPAVRGTVRVGAHDLDTEPVAARGSLGYLPETADLFPYLTPRELLRTVAAVRRTPMSRAVGILELLLRPAAFDLQIGTLSTGQRRKVLLTLATFADPPVLLLDEPANALDGDALQWLRDRLVRWRDDGRAIVVASHRPRDLADDWDGEFMCQDGTVAEIDG